MFKLITKIIIACTAVILIIYDIFVSTNDEARDTISEVMLGWSYKIQVIPFAFGILAGHLFWPSNWTKYRTVRVIVLGTLGAVILVLGLVGVIPRITPAIPMILGILAGHFLWNQKEQNDK